MKHNAEITLPVELVFDVLEPMQMGDMLFPAMVEIREVLLEVTGPSGKPRMVNLLKTIPESQILLWEDEILEAYAEQDLEE